MKKVHFCSATAGRTESRHCTGQETAIFFVQAAAQRQISVAQARDGAEATGFPVLSLAHEMPPTRTESGYPQRKTRELVLAITF